MNSYPYLIISLHCIHRSQIINPLQPGITPLALKTAFAVFNTGVIFYSWLTWSFTRRNVVAFAAIVGKERKNNEL